MRPLNPGRAVLSAILVPLLTLATGHSSADEPANWPALRGADGRGISAETGLPITWGENESIEWKTPIPGKGHSSPIVWSNRIFITSAIKGAPVEGHGPVEHFLEGQKFVHPDSVDAAFRHQYRVLALDADNGEILWDALAHEGVPYDDRHRSGSFASPTPVTDGDAVYAYFGTPGIFAYDFDGNLLWKTHIGDIATLGMGVATSPLLFEDLVIIQADEDLGENSFIVALDKRTGEQVWKTPRQVQVSWSTPLLVEHEGRAELITSGNEWLVSYAPATGRELWRVKGLESNAIHRPLVYDDLVILTAGFPTKITKAIRLGGSGDVTDTEHVVWTYGKGTAYVASNLVYGDHVYLTTDSGIITCLDAATGQVVYEGGRMPVPQKFFASAVAYEGKFLMPGQDGEVFVIQAGPEFNVLASNSLAEQIWATPAISRGRIYIRTLQHLWAIGTVK